MPGITPTFAQLRELSVDELILRFDQLARSKAEPGLSFFREEIARRDAAAQTEAIRKMTACMQTMTAAITGLTVINVILAAVLVFRG